MQRHECSYQSGISPYGYYVGRRSLTLCSSVLHVVTSTSLTLVATVMPHCFCHRLKPPYGPSCWLSPPSGRVATLVRCWDLVSIARRRSSGCGSIALLFIVHGSATVVYEFRCQSRRVRVLHPNIFGIFAHALMKKRSNSGTGKFISPVATLCHDA